MRINYDLVRIILKRIADDDGSQDLDTTSFFDLHTSQNLVAYHIEMLIQAGYIKGINASYKDFPYNYIQIELTYNGQIYFERIENDTIWNKTKQYLADNAIPLGFKTIFEYSKVVITALTHQ